MPAQWVYMVGRFWYFSDFSEGEIFALLPSRITAVISVFVNLQWLELLDLFLSFVLIFKLIFVHLDISFRNHSFQYTTFYIVTFLIFGIISIAKKGNVDNFVCNHFHYRRTFDFKRRMRRSPALNEGSDQLYNVYGIWWLTKCKTISF